MTPPTVAEVRFTTLPAVHPDANRVEIESAGGTVVQKIGGTLRADRTDEWYRGV